MTAKLLPTTVVGSYPQPDWLVDRQLLSKGVARVRLDLWRVAEPWLEQAQDDATLLAIRDMERAGIDIITDGEIRRESYSNRFATSLEGIASGKPGEVTSKAGLATAVPRVVGPPHPCGRNPRHGIPSPQYRADGEDHAAGSVHHEPAGGQRIL
jgi:5-methyltetrahydropteroyltriglutamate--homocysteine methyltransferase